MNLFSEFAGISPDQWKEQIKKDLKGVEADQLISHNQSGISIKPFYTNEDLKGITTPITESKTWETTVQIPLGDAVTMNKAALKALGNGASGLSFVLPQDADPNLVLKDISLEHIYTQFALSFDQTALIKQLVQYHKRNSFDGKYKCFPNLDPLYLRIQGGKWHRSATADLEVLDLMSHIPVNGKLYLEAGANQVNQCALILLHLKEYLDHQGSEKLKSKTAVHLQVSIAGEFFSEIAKLRALRILCRLLLDQYNLGCDIHIHAETARINKSTLDMHTNMLRTTTEAMSAVIGGCDSLVVLRFDDGFRTAEEFSERIAVNQQHVLRFESYLDKVSEISAGSYYIENLTNNIAEQAWEKLKTLDNEGGYIKCLESGTIHDLIENDYKQALEKYRSEESVLVGVNKYPNKIEKPLLVPTQSASVLKGQLVAKRFAEQFELNTVQGN